MKSQPDFQKLFFEFFGPSPKKVTYKVRPDSNRKHDLIFLDSLIHEARINPGKMKIQKKRLTLTLNRDCWELGLVECKKGFELYVADSQLTIYPISEVKWCFQNNYLVKTGKDLWIRNLVLERSGIEMPRIILEGLNWSFHVQVTREDFTMKLQDVENPYLFSQKGKASRRRP